MQKACIERCFPGSYQNPGLPDNLSIAAAGAIVLFVFIMIINLILAQVEKRGAVEQ